MLNEYIKNTGDVLIEFWVKLFNRVYNSGEVPAEWSKGTLYKGKGTHCDPKNYRGITLLSCIGKLFTSVLNNRLTLFVTLMMLSRKTKQDLERNIQPHITFSLLNV